uniref:FNIp repeat-containing protein n=1 Tax=viral metagenome TaxID=1070528 RepID=A0A6C0CCL1_9ZZZZ
MITRYEDMIFEIAEFLTNKEKIMFSATCIYMNSLKCQFIYSNKIHVYRITQLPYFNNFQCVKISQKGDIYPESAMCIHHEVRKPGSDRRDLRIPNNVTHLTFYMHINPIIKNYIPPTVTHLTLDKFFNNSIRDCIPPFITHLTFGKAFNKSVKNRIPASVTHLIFGDYFNHQVDNIPPSVTHLIFGESFNQSINNLPDSITHLAFGRYFSKTINKIPSSVIEIKLNEEYAKNITEDVVSRVNIIKISNIDD